MATKKVQYQIKADDKSKAALKSARAGLKKLRSSINSTVKAGAALGIAAAAGLVILVKANLKSIDVLGKTADKLGLTTEAWIGLTHAVSITGVEVKTLEKAITKQQKAIFDADRGLVTYKQHFDTLGLSTKKLMQLNPEQQFFEIADALNKIENQTLKTAIAYDLFGGRGTALINTLALGREGLEKMKEESKLLGLSLSKIEVAQVEKANDQLTRVQAVFKGISQQVAVQLSPIIDALAEQFISSAKEGEGVGDSVAKGMNVAVKVIGFTMDVLNGLKLVFKAIELAVAAFVGGAIIGFDKVNKAVVAFANRIPGLDIKPSNELSEWAEVSRIRITELKNELKDMAEAKLPSEKFKAFFEKVTRESKLAAEQVAKDKMALLTANAPGLTDVSLENDSTAEDAKAQKEIDKIRAKFLTKREVLDEHLALEKEQLMLADDDAFNNKAERTLLLEQLERAHQATITSIAKKEAREREVVDAKASKARQAVTQGMFRNLTSLMSSGSKKMFDIGKFAARASVVVDGVRAVASSYAAGAKVGGPLVGAAFAATAAAAVKNQLDAVNSTSFGGGGSIPNSGGGVNAPVQTPPPPEPIDPEISNANTRTKITIVGSAKDGDSITVGQFKDFMERFKDAADHREIIFEINGERAEVF